MRKYKEIADGIIISVGKSFANGITISDDEYKEILLTIKNKPSAPDGYDYRLRTDMTWELVELPPAPVAYTQETLGAMTNAALEQILSGFGITASMNKENMIRLILQAQGDKTA